MSDEDLKAFAAQQMPPPTDVPAPEIPPPAIKRIGRHERVCPCARCVELFGPVDKRPPLVGRSNQRRPQQNSRQQLQTEIDKRLPKDAMLTDENVGKALAGAFAAMAMFRGGHWRLFPTEQHELGECFGPYARLYGSEELAMWVGMLMVIPVVTGIVMPRIAIEQQIMKGNIAKEEGRQQLLGIKAFVAAEAGLDIERQVKEKQAEATAFLNAKVRAGVAVASEFRQQEERTEGIVNGTDTTEA